MYWFAISYLPDWAWDLYRWSANTRGARTRYPNLLRYMAFQRQIRAVMWGDR